MLCYEDLSSYIKNKISDNIIDVIKCPKNCEEQIDYECILNYVGD